MTEEMIRRQTEKLLAAYRSLTGRHGNPTYDEFLMLRSRAITELEEHISEEMPYEKEAPFEEITNNIEKSNEKPKKNTKKEKEEVAISLEEKKEIVPDAPSKPVKQESKKADTPPAEKIPNIVTITKQHNVTEDNDEDESDETELSDFEILSRLADPWNS